MLEGRAFTSRAPEVTGGAVAHVINHMPLHTPRLKIIRRLGTPLPGLTRKTPAARERAACGAAAVPDPLLWLPSHLARESNGIVRGQVVSMPARHDVPFPVREALVVAYYAR